MIVTVANQTLHAKWTINNYTITYVIDNTIQTITLPYNTTIELPTTNPKKAGHTFDCWTINDSCVDNITVMPGYNVTLHSKWDNQ